MWRCGLQKLASDNDGIGRLTAPLVRLGDSKSTCDSLTSRLLARAAHPVLVGKTFVLGTKVPSIPKSSSQRSITFERTRLMPEIYWSTRSELVY
jgi:hypothetical protein